VINNWHIGQADVDHEGLEQTMYGYREAGGKGEVATIADLGDSICAYLNQVASQANLSLDRAQPAAHWQGAGRGMPALLQHPSLDVYEEAVRAAATL